MMMSELAAPGDRTVLIVEDDDCLRLLLGTLLNAAGFKTLSASSGEEAIERLAERPDALLLDLAMPGVGGIGVLKSMRESSKPAPPVLVVTGQANDHSSVREAAMDPNVRRVFAKPLNDEFLVKALHGLLGTAPS